MVDVLIKWDVQETYILRYLLHCHEESESYTTLESRCLDSGLEKLIREPQSAQKTIPDSRCVSPDKILAYAGCSPSTYQSGKLTNCYAHMEKRGSRYLRYALYNATKYVCYWNPVFAKYLAKKRAEGKHYNVALSHAMKKLVRLIYALQKSGKAYLTAA